MFPSQLVEGAIRDEIEAAIRDRPAPRRPWEPEVDSLVMIRTIIRIEEETGLNLPDDLMPAGGFNDIDHCVDVVMQKCREIWTVDKPVKEEV